MKTGYIISAIQRAILLLVLMPLPVQAALSLSDVPLFLTTAVDPNIIFTLDDSGSMQFEIMPEGLIIKDVRFVYPRVSSTYGGGSYNNYVAGFDSNNGYTAKLRSSHVNKIYYDPTVRYLPWSKADGSLMDNANITCAPHNPFNTAAGCRNFQEDNSDTAGVKWLNSGGTLTDATVTTTGTGSKKKTVYESFFPAVYFQYKGSGSIDSASSYTQVEIRSGKTYAGGAGRTDCAAAMCTYDEEIQNFANWYTYYRSRVLLARAGVGLLLQHRVATCGLRSAPSTKGVLP